jgi:hypothetical protein
MVGKHFNAVNIAIFCGEGSQSLFYLLSLYIQHNSGIVEQ